VAAATTTSCVNVNLVNATKREKRSRTIPLGIVSLGNHLLNRKPAPPDFTCGSVNFHEISWQHDELPGKCRRIRHEHAPMRGVARGGGFCTAPRENISRMELPYEALQMK